MDGLKLPVILLVIVLALGIFLFNPFANKKGHNPVKIKTHQAKEISQNQKTDLKNVSAEFEKKNYSKVIELLESESDKNNYEQQKLLGYSYSAIKEFDKAIIAFENCLRIRKVPEIGYSLAYIYETTGRIKVARQLYEDVLKADLPPKMKRSVYEGLARTSGFENDTKTAFKYAKELARLYPESPEGFISLVKILKDTGKTKGLDKLTDVADKFHSGNYQYNFWLGVLLFETGDFKESLKRFRKCIQIMPENSTPYFYTYKILKRMKNMEMAPC